MLKRFDQLSGCPPHNSLEDTSLATILPAAIIDPFPIWTPGSIVVLAPIHTPLSILILLYIASPALCLWHPIL